MRYSSQFPFTHTQRCTFPNTYHFTRSTFSNWNLLIACKGDKVTVSKDRQATSQPHQLHDTWPDSIATRTMQIFRQRKSQNQNILPKILGPSKLIVMKHWGKELSGKYRDRRRSDYHEIRWRIHVMRYPCEQIDVRVTVSNVRGTNKGRYYSVFSFLWQ